MVLKKHELLEVIKKELYTPVVGDILDQMDFIPAVSDKLRLMDARLFEETWGGLEPVLK